MNTKYYYYSEKDDKSEQDVFNYYVSSLEISQSDEQNKYTNYCILLQNWSTTEDTDKNTFLEAIENAIKKVSKKFYIFKHLYQKQNSAFYVAVIVTKTRIRKFTLEKQIKKSLIEDNAFQDDDDLVMTTFRYSKSFYKLNLNKNFLVSSDQEESFEYSGKDISILDTVEGRYPWQNDVLRTFIGEEQFLPAPQRKINYVYDSKGNTGKSLFVKWCCVNFPDEIMKFTYSTPTQLRTGIISEGIKKVYFIDLPRTRSQYDSGDAILSVIEDLKGGFITSMMYGKSQKLIMDPPHIFIFSNRACPIKSLSSDRWDLKTINSETYTFEEYNHEEALRLTQIQDMKSANTIRDDYDEEESNNNKKESLFKRVFKRRTPDKDDIV